MAKRVNKQDVLTMLVNKHFSKADIVEVRKGFALIRLQHMKADEHVYPFAKLGSRISHFDGLLVIEL